MRIQSWMWVPALIGLASCQIDQGGGVGQQQSAISSVDNYLRRPPDREWTRADEDLIAPVWRGTDDKGTLFTPFHRAGSAAVEDFVYAPPDGDCTKLKATARIDWDSAANTVHVLLKYKNMPLNPTVDKQEGTEWFFNPFHQKPRSFTRGGYRNWILFNTINTGTVVFWYSEETLQLLGSDLDFPNGPPDGAFPLNLPVFPIASSLLMFPEKNGFISHSYTSQYDHFAVEGGAYAPATTAFIPQDLCQSPPFQPALGQLRPYVAPWQPPSTAPSWKAVLKAGIIMDTTVDDATSCNFDQVPFDPRCNLPGGNFPYVFSGNAFMQSNPFVPGGIPNGMHFSIPTAIENVGPNLVPVPGGNGTSCQPFVSFPRVNMPNLCQ
jgi:hypothetical protein